MAAFGAVDILVRTPVCSKTRRLKRCKLVPKLLIGLKRHVHTGRRIPARAEQAWIRRIRHHECTNPPVIHYRRGRLYV